MAEPTKAPSKKGSGEKSAAPRKTAAKPKPTSAPREDEEPVLSGRMIIALAFALAMVVIPQQSTLRDAITKTAPQTTVREAWKVGQTANIHLTVVTADYSQMACADTRRSGEAHCEYENERKRWPQKPDAPVDDNKRTVLQPYRTTDKNLLFLPGLWAQPEVAMRLHNEPSQGVSETKLARFVVECEVKFLEEWQNAFVRWKPNERWSNQGTAMVGELVSCHILEDEKS
jgi:hypothetical protein